MIDRWGAGYFGVNANGELTVAPLQENGIAVPIIDALREAHALNLKSPILIRFQDLLRHRVEGLNHAFSRAITEYNAANPSQTIELRYTSESQPVSVIGSIILSLLPVLLIGGFFYYVMMKARRSL